MPDTTEMISRKMKPKTIFMPLSPVGKIAANGASKKGIKNGNPKNIADKI